MLLSAYQQQWYVNILNTYYPKPGILTLDNIAFPLDMIQNQFALFTAIVQFVATLAQY
jgi:hypothetical protein